MKHLMTITLFSTLLWAFCASATSPTRPAPMYPTTTGSEEVVAPVAYTPYPEFSRQDEIDLIGDTTTLGMTWYDIQHNGTCGRMNTLESNGWRQFCWMNGLSAGGSSRHIWWNAIDPNGFMVFPHTGVQVESSYRGGFVNMDVKSSGAGVLAYQAVIGSPTNPAQIVISEDLYPHTGAFLDYLLPPAPYPLLWPRIQINQNQKIQIVGTTQSSSSGNPQRQYCLTVPFSNTWTFMDWTQTIAADVATSPAPGSNKTLWAWTRSREYGVTPPNLDSTYNQVNNDIYYLIDNDGLNPDFSQKINLTNFIPPQLQFLPDTLLACMDTMRAYTDLNCFIDHNNVAHITFTTRSYFQIWQMTYWNTSLIWTWSEQFPDSFRVVGSEAYWAYNNNVDCGAWNVKAQRPCLGQAPNGYLYCMYQVYDTDTMHLTDPPDFMPSGEVYMSVSTDGGVHWSQGVNVTNTISPYNAAAGQCWSEVSPIMAKRVNDYGHIEYVVDKDAGSIVHGEGAWSLNPVRYHRVPVAQIPTTPLLVQTKRLHVTSTHLLNVTMIPLSPPIIIPANGGSFNFNASVHRNMPPMSPFYVWARDRYPNGTYTGYLLGPVQINPPPGVTVTRQRT
jgi:hypothetical protein